VTDEYDGIFDDASVEDFLRESSAKSEVPRTNDRLDTFNQFVEEQLRAVRTAWIAAETYMQPLALVANQEKQRIFIPDDDETLGQFVDRMHREAKAMDATWTFIAQRTLVGSSYGPPVDVSDDEAVNEAIKEGLLHLGLLWYAEQRDEGNRYHRHGQMVDDNGTLGPLKEGAASQSLPLFERILGD